MQLLFLNIIQAAPFIHLMPHSIQSIYNQFPILIVRLLIQELTSIILLIKTLNIDFCDISTFQKVCLVRLIAILVERFLLFFNVGHLEVDAFALILVDVGLILGLVYEGTRVVVESDGRLVRNVLLDVLNFLLFALLFSGFLAVGAIYYATYVGVGL